jgi:outer membrane protein assembly factor BamB
MRPTHALLIVALLAGLLRAQEWPRFRGANGSGVNPNARIKPDWTDADVLWKVKLSGGGISSPVVWSDKVFVLSAQLPAGGADAAPAAKAKKGKAKAKAAPGERADRIASCLDAATGKVLWEKSFPAPANRTHHFNVHATGTPVVDEQAVYFAWGSPEKIEVVAFTHAGKLLWQSDLGPYNTGFGFGASLVGFEDVLIFTNEQEGGPASVVALHKKNGKVAWTTPRDTDRACFSTPCIWQSGDAAPQLILTNWNLGVTALDPRTGKAIWERRGVFGTKAERAISSPVAAGDFILATCGFTASPKNLVALKPAAAQNGTNEPVWKMVDQAVSHIPTPLILGQRVYLWADNGVVSCLELSTGRKIWSQRLEADPATYFASPISDGQTILGVSEYGNVVAIAAGDTFKQLSQHNLDELIRSTPALSGGKLFIRTFEHLYCIDAGK